MKIAFVVFDDVSGGGAMAHRIQMLSRGLVSLGHEVHIIAPLRYQPGPLSQEIGGLKFHWGAMVDAKSANHLLTKIRKRYLLVKICKLILSQGLHWLILYEVALEAWPIVTLARRYGCFVAADHSDIHYVRNNEYSLRQIWLTLTQMMGHRFISPRLDLNFVISRQINSYLKNLAPEVPTVVVPAPVDIRQYQTRKASGQEFRNKFHLQHSLIIGYFGSTYQCKGPEILLKAAQLLMHRGREFKLLISGKADQNLQLQQLIDDLGLRDRIILTGFMPDKELISAMAAADILVEPKTEHDINVAAFPQKLAEYLAMGKSIVASGIGDITQYLHDQDNAILCQPGDPLSLANGLERLLRDRQLRNKLAREARNTAITYFDAKIISRLMESALTRYGKVKWVSPHVAEEA